MSLVTLTTLISNRLQKLSELFSAQRAPAGYRPGVTLEYLRRNLGQASFTATGPARAAFCLDDVGLRVDVTERTEAQLLMHLVMTEFMIKVPASEQGSARFELHHSGSIRRMGLTCRQRAGAPALLTRLQAALNNDLALHQALMVLDFKRLHIELSGHQWQVRLEHMGGSEVVNRMPSFRRYIPLSSVQRTGLFTVLAGLQRVLSSV
ncbi:DUF3156 family protein [Pseudomonas salomonii]|uniref:DUF3156 domain-containing protein n=1 Tax=Pseudomonas salomonii TaxID=191391 RepID=A0A1H3FPM2_9PSED|nr:DUF3156 family protein [Pseudomonas salomonii]SDX93002.1 Protein of unknown function [Pseudomonas salomonii]